MTRDNPYVSNLPVSAFPHHSSYLATASGLPFSLLQSIDGSSDNSIQGKVAELRQELNGGGKKDKNHSAKKITLKKIVANMTMSNNDMVALFPDIVNCMQIPSLEIKKMYVPHASVQVSLG
jgi:AP-2 complex subunit beta-1